MNDLIEYLGDLDARLFSTEFMDFLLSLPDEPRKELNAMRKRIAVLYAGLTNQRLSIIADRFDELKDDLLTARKDLDESIGELEDAAKLAKNVARVADLAAKIVIAV